MIYCKLENVCRGIILVLFANPHAKKPPTVIDTQIGFNCFIAHIHVNGLIHIFAQFSPSENNHVYR